MSDGREPQAGAVVARRRFLGLLGALLGGLGVTLGTTSGATRQPEADVPRERPLKEADFYRPHDLAG